MIWFKKIDGDFVNLETGVLVDTVEADTDQWRIRVVGHGVNNILNLGPYGTQAAAQAVAQQLTAGVDPDLIA